MINKQQFESNCVGLAPWGTFLPRRLRFRSPLGDDSGAQAVRFPSLRPNGIIAPARLNCARLAMNLFMAFVLANMAAVLHGKERKEEQ